MRTTREMVREQLELQLKIVALAQVNIVNCGRCDSLVFHDKTQGHTLTCPYCKMTSDSSDFPDFLHEGIINNSEFDEPDEIIEFSPEEYRKKVTSMIEEIGGDGYWNTPILVPPFEFAPNHKAKPRNNQ